MSDAPALSIRPAQAADVDAIFGMIHELAVFEKLEHLVVATPALLHTALFGAQPACEALVGEVAGELVTYALFFHNFSSFLCRKGLYLEDLYVQPGQRGNGYGRQMLVALAQLALQRDCGRFEWTVLNWNAKAISMYQGMGADLLQEWNICRVAGAALDQMAHAPSA